MDLVPKNFSSLDKDVIENGSGTHSLPVLVGIAPGEKGKGVVFIIKIEDKYFFMYKKHAGAKWLTLRCGKFHPPTKCTFSIRIRNINNLSIEEDGFFDVENWEIIRDVPICGIWEHLV